MTALADHQTGKTLGITFWESEEALRANEEAADRLREDSAGYGPGLLCPGLRSLPYSPECVEEAFSEVGKAPHFGGWHHAYGGKLTRQGSVRKGYRKYADLRLVGELDRSRDQERQGDRP